MNDNRIETTTWSNPESRALFESKWDGDLALLKDSEYGRQCGGCSFFAPFNHDWGLCCHQDSRHHLETIFEHFTCPAYVHEGWGPHSFSVHAEDHCRCEGDGTAS